MAEWRKPIETMQRRKVRAKNASIMKTQARENVGSEMSPNGKSFSFEFFQARRALTLRKLFHTL